MSTVDGAVPCPTSCSLGAKSCDGNGVRTCEQLGSCTAWSAAVACGAGVCSGGQCVTTCTSQCTLGATYCSADGYRSCIQTASGCNDWSSTVTSCTGGQVCSGGGCAATCADRCAAGAKQCSGSGVQTCEVKASGCLDWSDPVPCTGGNVCTAGMCVASSTNQCATGDKRCMGGDQIQTCQMQASGCLDWSPAQLCPGGGTCAGNQCVSCTSGAKRCGGSTVEECMAGAWTPISSCPFGCNLGSCTTSVSCTAGAYRCNGNTVEICNSSGSAYLATATCANSCSAGLCTGACTSGSKRCNGANVETCNGAGTAWAVSDTCTTFCDGATAQCALNGLNVTSNMNLDGEVVVQGAVIVRAGATLTSPSGNLTLRASSITVELNGNIVAAPTGQTATGAAPVQSTGSQYYCGSGGSYAGSGATCGYQSTSSRGSTYGSQQDSNVEPGSKGGQAGSGAAGGSGGGVIRLIADIINIAGNVTADGQTGSPNMYGGGGGGSGGGILLAADSLTVSGNLSTNGGPGGNSAAGPSYTGGAGGLGRVKLLGGVTRSITGTVTGTRSDGLLPPMQLTSSSHPNPALIYNDDFAAVAVTWNRPFPSRQGYYQRTSTSPVAVPTPATGTFVATELASIDRSLLVNGANYFHIAPVDAMSNVGTVEANFRIQINTTPPTVTSSSHTTPTTWYTNRDVFYAWTFPIADVNLKGAYYVLDHYGDTVPSATATFLPVTQKQILRSSLDDGIWTFHLVSVDQKGYLTKQAQHYQVRIGADPGPGGVLGKVTNGSSQNIANATVRVNRGLFPNRTTDSMGSYNFGVIPLGSWEVTASAPGYQPQTKTITIDSASPTATVNFTLMP